MGRLGAVIETTAATSRQSASGGQESFQRVMRPTSAFRLGSTFLGTTPELAIMFTKVVQRGATHASAMKNSGMTTNNRTCAPMTDKENSRSLFPVKNPIVSRTSHKSK